MTNIYENTDELFRIKCAKNSAEHKYKQTVVDLVQHLCAKMDHPLRQLRAQIVRFDG